MNDLAIAVSLLLIIAGMATLAVQYALAATKIAALRKENAELQKQIAIYKTVNELRGTIGSDSRHTR
jgi:hypothetical protein